jgi:hypothetical protein
MARYWIIRLLAIFGLDLQDVKYVIRNFALAFAAVFVPGVLGWLNTVSQWLNDSTKPVPSWHALGALVAAATVAGFVALFTLVLRAVEGKFGKALLRPNPPKK